MTQKAVSLNLQYFEEENFITITPQPNLYPFLVLIC